MGLWEIINRIIDSGRLGLLDGLAFLVALVFALVLHEVAHGLVALWNGDPTAKERGRLSLNPVRHFDLVGFLMMLIVGLGWAKPVPVNPRNFKKYRTGCITVSLAGVTTNILLAFIFAMPVILIGVLPDETEITESIQYLTYFFSVFSSTMVTLNVSFALFNLLPLYPLDGYRLLSCFVNEGRPFMRFMRRFSLYIMLILILWNVIPFISDYSPLNLYIGTVGGWIGELFSLFWRLIF